MFALYESHDDEQFIRVDTGSTFNRIDNLSVERNREALSGDHGPVSQRIVPATDEEEFPLYAKSETLSEIVRDNNEMFP